MNYVAIPSDLFEDPGFRSISVGDRDFLIRLYQLFSDCESFLPTTGMLSEAGFHVPIDWRRKMTRLTDVGLLMMDSKVRTARRGAPARIFKFKYESLQAYQ